MTTFDDDDDADDDEPVVPTAVKRKLTTVDDDDDDGNIDFYASKFSNRLISFKFIMLIQMKMNPNQQKSLLN